MQLKNFFCIFVYKFKTNGKNSLVFSNLTLFINNIINNEPFINALHDNNITLLVVCCRFFINGLKEQNYG